MNSGLNKQVFLKGIAFLFLCMLSIPLYFSQAQEIPESTISSEGIPIEGGASTTPYKDDSVQKEQIVLSPNTPVANLLTGKNTKEKANIKADKLSKLKIKEPFSSQDGRITVSIEQIDKIDQGVQVFVKAWKDGEQLGFGADGSVEIERIKIINPPILVRRSGLLGENLEEALKESVIHTVLVIGKDGSNIQKGKVGRTTTTIYPDAGTGGTTVDGYVRRNRSIGFGETWSNLRSGNGVGSGASHSIQEYYRFVSDSSSDRWRVIQRSIFLFDTSSIPDTDVISSAHVSLFGTSKLDEIGATTNESEMHIVSSTPASHSSLQLSDFSKLGDTDFGSVAYADFSTTSYNDITLNSSGIANIDKTGVTKFGTRSGADLDNDTPSWPGTYDKTTSLLGYYADQTGTTNDPKLIVTHAGEPETVTIFSEPGDGYITNSYCNEDTEWSNARGFSGPSDFSVCYTQDYIKVRSDAEDGSYQIYRGSLVFDTSVIPDGATINEATINVYASSTSGYNTTGLVLTSHTRVATSSLSADDWYISDFGTTTLGSTTSALATSTYTGIVLNSSGLSAISDTGTTVFGLLTTDDFSNSDPGSSRTEATIVSTDAPGTTTAPYIQITYTE